MQRQATTVHFGDFADLSQRACTKACTLIVSGLDARDWSKEEAVMTRHGCLSGEKTLQEKGSGPWCAVRFPSWTAADACAASLEDLGHLQMCIEPDWQTYFGDSRAAATADLVQLAELLGCRHKRQTLARHEALGLVRGTPDILAAVERAGGAQALAAADPAAAACLCCSLMRVVIDDTRHGLLPSNMGSHVERAFAALAPSSLQAAAAGLRDGTAGAPQLACAAVQLVQAFLRRSSQDHGGEAGSQVATASADDRQKVAPGCIELLHSIAYAVSVWLVDVSSAALRQQQQQGQQQESSTHQPSRECQPASELRDTAVWLPAAASALLRCLSEHRLYGVVDPRHLLHTLGQLLPRVVMCVQREELAAAAGLWALEAHDSSAAGCVAQLHCIIVNMVSTMDTAACAPEMPALCVATTRALGTAADHLAAPRHLALLLHLSLVAQAVLVGGALENLSTLLPPLARVQQLATTWVSDHPAELPPAGMTNRPPSPVEDLSTPDQAALLMDVNADHLAAAVLSVLRSPEDGFTTDPNCVFESGAVDALAMALQYAKTTAAVVALVRGGLGSLDFAHAESAAQADLSCTARAAGQPDRSRPYRMRLFGAKMIAGVIHSLTLHAVQGLAKHGLTASLVQALPWVMTSSESATSVSSWRATELGTWAVGSILAAIMAADTSEYAAVLRDGSWAAAMQRVRCLEPPPSLAAVWHACHEQLLHQWARASGAGRSASRRGAGAAAAPPDAEAVAAAERAMQELLDEEPPTEASSQRSKAASKRARKKAARQRAAAADPTAQLTNPAAHPTTMISCPGQAADSSRSSMPAASPPQPDAMPEEPAVESSLHDSADAACLPLQQPAANTGHRAAGPDWLRCPLSGRAMRDPVLYGIGGHSFERGALEEWLAANPGVDPLSRRPLPPGGDAMLPNHALRNMIQQLQLG